MRIIGCGSRYWTDGAMVHATLFGLTSLAGDDPYITVIEGQCPYGGADKFVAEWANVIGAEWFPMPAEVRNGIVQGPARNAEMLAKLLKGPPTEQRFVVAFKDGFQRDKPPSYRGGLAKARGGTESMVRLAREAGIPTYVISHG